MKSNLQFTIYNLQKGYTLIELLVVMMVLITVGFIIATILVSSLRGTNKAVTTETVRRNGNYAILQMSKMIEFAQSFGGMSNDNSSFSTTCPSASPTPQYKYIKIRSFDDLNTSFSFSCTPNSSAPIASNGASFVNTEEVSASNCYFTCLRPNVSQPPVIGINFTLSQKSASNFFEKRATIPFQTSVIMRNLNE